ncbi:MAG: zinc metalloprotease HtpX [Aggregatilineales bacterium]
MNSTIRTTFLLATLTGLFLFIGLAIGGRGGMIIAFILASALNMGAWWFSSSLALRFSGASEVSPEDAPELHQLVESLALRAEIPKPRVYMIESDLPNAFATGRSPQHGAVAVTTGIMRLLMPDELAGVIAHELAHIKHRDTLISSVAATIGGAVTMLADMAMWVLIFGGLGGQDDEDDGIAGIVGGVLMIFLAPLAAILIQMAISRSREFSADASGARILGNPLPLASALEKLEAQSMQAIPEQVNPSTAHLYIVNPLHGGGIADLFRTHPKTEERIERLRRMNQTERVPLAA